MGILYLVATPIGNLEDLSSRAVRILRETNLIAAEDTRHTKILLNHFNIDTRRLTSYFEHNKLQRLEYILEALTTGDVALVSDAGTPTINDPGYELVKAALAAHFDVVPVPGPSAPITALTVSGLPTDSFLYLGYLPHKASDRRARLQEIAEQPFTLIFLETPHRLMEALEDVLAILGDRHICVAREMTKKFEEYWRGEVREALERFKFMEPRGEFTLVIAGKQKKESEIWTEDELLTAIKKKLEKDTSVKELATELAKVSGWNRRDVYALINSRKNTL